VRVLTINLWGRTEPWRERREVQIAGLRQIGADLMAFQEAVVTDEYDQVADLLPVGYHVAHHPIRDNNGLGISIASRWPLEEVRKVDLQVTPRTAGFPCTLLTAEVVAPDPIGRVLFANHLPSWQLDLEYERELQTVRAACAIAEQVGDRQAHVIVAGDLDADPRAATIRFWTGRQSLDELSVCYRDAWESVHGATGGETYTNRNGFLRDWDWPFSRIDYILVRCGEHGGPTLRIADCALAFDEPVDGVWASDHFGVVADLELPPPMTISSPVPHVE
jgi:endonuclease/exonuclease/phosphatase family metal-dependent hydrolase